MKPRLGRRAALVLAVVLGLGAGNAHGTTYVVPSDDWLVAQAPIIAEVSVMSVSSSPASGTPATDLIVLVERLFKGRLGGTSVVIRIPGGVRADGIGLRVEGVPRFAEGDTVLLFLAPRRDGAFGLVHLGLGAFRRATLETDSGSLDVAIRDLGGKTSPLDPPRRWEAFTQWLADPAAVVETLVPVDSESSSALPERMPVADAPLAWEELRRGRRVAWRWATASESHAPTRMLRRVFKRWAVQPGARGVLRAEAGAPIAGPALRDLDGSNDIALDSDDGLVAGRFSCARGGLAAMSGVWFDTAESFRLRAGRGGRALKALEADIVLNDGAECLFGRGDGSRGADQVLLHEIGHTLGLGHSEEPDSVMWPLLTEGARTGGFPSEADRAALAALYAARPTRLGSQR